MAAASGLLLSCAVCVPLAAAEGKIQLSTDAAPRHRQVTTTLTAEGSLVIPDKEDKTRKLPIRIEGEQVFVDDTRPLGGKRKGRSLRHYRQAAGKIVVNKQEDRLELSPNRRLIAVDRTAEGVQLFSPVGLLTRADLELLEMQFDVAVLNDLIPGEGVSKGDGWDISAATSALLFGLDSAEPSSLRGITKAIGTNSVEITLSGEVKGVADGAKTKITVDGTITFDRRAGQFSELTVSFREARDPSPTAPGFDLKSKLASRIAATANPPELAPTKVADIADRWAPTVPQLDFSSVASEIGLIHDRSWHVTSHRRELIVLRKTRGETQIAQCNITRLPDAGGDKSLELKQFEEQVQKALGDKFGKIEEASKATGDGNLEIFRIAASGQVNEVPITWIYFHLAAKDGRRAALVFTLSSDNLEKFAASDHDLIGGFRFLEAKPPEQATRPEGEATRRE